MLYDFECGFYFFFIAEDVFRIVIQNRPNVVPCIWRSDEYGGHIFFYYAGETVVFVT